MRHGEITCSCGKVMYIETANTQIDCIDCNKTINVEHLPIKEDIQVIEEGE